MTIVSRLLTTSIAVAMMSEVISSPSTITAGVTHLPSKQHGRRRSTPSATTPSPFCKSTHLPQQAFFADCLFSLSEYGCTKSTRQFGEVSTLYSDKMTSVYSGGLVYEYTMEGDTTQQKFGLVDVQSSSSVTERPDFALLKDALAKAPAPSGDGGYKTNGAKSDCPAKSATWVVDGDGLPAMPPQAKQYFAKGAGTGVGLTGDGSQEFGAESTGTASAGSGVPTKTGSSSSSSASGSKGAASGLRVPEFSVAPIICGLVVLVSSFLGGAVLL